MTAALSHIKVLDLSRILAGPTSTQLLADLGAEVIKVERPEGGDDTRGWGPPFLADAQGKPTTDSSYFLSANRGKKSITVDYSKAEGQEIIRRLAAASDVLVENYKVGTLAQYGLAYEDLKQVNPQLIYCSITGFGQTGPHAHLPGYDFVFQGMGGLMSVTGLPDDQPGGGPVKVGIAIGDILTGMYATVAILGALEFRRVSGVGQHIDLSLLDSVVALNSYQALNYFMSGRVPRRQGNAHPNMVPYQTFRCSDGHIILAIGNDSQFQRFAAAAGRPEWANDPNFAKVADRVRNRDTLVPQIAELMLKRTMSEWVAQLEAISVPCGPIFEMDRVFQDPQVAHRQMRLDLPHSAGVNAPAVANPIRYSHSPISYTHAAPILGEHTTDVLRQMLGMPDETVKQLRNAGVI